MYEKGLGANRDYREAMRWYGKAAAQGDSYAQYKLGWMYLNGLGVTEDKVEAYKWFYIASLNGFSEAWEECKKLRKGFFGLGALSEDEIAEAIRRAQEWIKSHPDAVKEK